MLIEQYDLPIGAGDLSRVEQILEAREALLTSFAPETPQHPYRALTYRRAQAHHSTEAVLLIDRNIATHWIASLRGEPLTPEQRAAAALMAFAQCSNIRVEPNLALYEVAQRLGPAVARGELHDLRTADNVPARGWTEAAVGRTTSLDHAYIDQAVVNPVPSDAAIDFTMPLKRWRRNYAIALRLAQLELEGGPPEPRLARLLDWMHSDFIIGGPAAALAATYLAPHSPRARLLHGLRSPDRTKALSGVRNVAWDLTYLSELLRRLREDDPLRRVTVLASFDQGVMRLGRTLLHDPALGDDYPFTSLWGETVGHRLAVRYATILESQDDPSRQINRPAPQGLVDTLIRTGEEAIVAWVPPR